jgi:hypothetical protein
LVVEASVPASLVKVRTAALLKAEPVFASLVFPESEKSLGSPPLETGEGSDSCPVVGL